MKEKEELFSKIFEDNSDDLYRHCFFRVSNKEIAEDIVADSFMKLWREFESDKDIKYPKTWLYRVSRNSIIDYYRKKKADSLDKHIEEFGDNIKGSDEEEIENNSEIALVMQKMERLAEDDRELLIMKYIDGLDTKTICEILDEPNAGTINVRLHRAVGKLKEMYNG